MSDKITTDHSCDSHDLRTNSNDNQRFNNNSPPFYVSPSLYQVIFINKFITSDIMQQLIDHARECTQYSLDTESEKSTQEIALIQIQSIPKMTPSFMIFIELEHLPELHSYIRAQVRQFLQHVFKAGNSLYSWGSIDRELQPALKHDLFTWPITASLINVQLLFPHWYSWALTRCELCSPDNTCALLTSDKALEETQLIFASCTCHPPSPYQNNQLWALQKALLYTYNLFLDKSMTMNHWSRLLDPSHSTLPKARRDHMIRYAAYDCFAITFLVQPVMGNWTFRQVMDVKPIDLFTEPVVKLTYRPPPRPTPINPIKPSQGKIKNINIQKLFQVMNDDDLESISDEEIYLHQITNLGPTTQKSHQELNDIHEFHRDSPVKNAESLITDNVNELDVFVDNHDLVIDENNINKNDIMETIEPPESNVDVPPLTTFNNHMSNNQRRSQAARTRRNKKRNNTHRMRRYQHAFTRPIYYKFTLRSIKKILKHHGIHFVHVKVVNNMLIIGVKQHHLQQYQQQLPQDIFDRHNYKLLQQQQQQQLNL